MAELESLCAQGQECPQFDGSISTEACAMWYKTMRGVVSEFIIETSGDCPVTATINHARAARSNVQRDLTRGED